jgi:hypothetical protein
MKWQACLATVLANRAALASERAAVRQQGWHAAEQAWLNVIRWKPSQAMGRLGLAQTYALWHQVDPDAALGAARQLITGSTDVTAWSESLTAIGDAFRGRGELGMAEELYRGALARADFSSPDVAAQTERLLALITRSEANLLENGNFANGIEGWTLHGQPDIMADEGDQLHLGCGGCRLEQVAPLLGSQVYRLSGEARSDNADYHLHVRLEPHDDAPWVVEQIWTPGRDWNTFSAVAWFPAYGSQSLKLSIEPLEAGGVWLRNWRFEVIDDPNNLLANASFDYFEPASASSEVAFPPWSPADFWNSSTASGWLRSAPGHDSPAALEIDLTGARGYPDRLGLQQNCGTYAAGARLELAAEVWIERDLVGAVARVEAVLYQADNSQNWTSVSLQQRRATPGWLVLVASGQVPATSGNYDCVVVVHVVAEQPLPPASRIARFDNVKLRLVSD